MIDGGNSYYRDDIDRAKRLATQGLHYVDCGTSGGVWGLERGYCLMIGGEPEVVARLDPIFATLAPGGGTIDRTRGHADGAPSTAEQGYLHCGPSGAGHFVKMVHNGIEYGLMAAYAEGFNILQQRQHRQGRRTRVDAETTPLRNPEYYQYDFDLADIAEVWRRGSVVASWLLDLTAAALNGRRRAGEVRGPRVGLGRGALDPQRRHRRGGAGATCCRRRCSSASARAARRDSRTAAVGDALRVRRPRRKGATGNELAMEGAR